jgi:hypothetical protein
MNVRIMIVILTALVFVPTAVFAQASTAPAEPSPAPTLSPEAQALANVKALYAGAKFEECRAAIENALALQASGDLHFLFYQLAEMYVYQALIVYAFRETAAAVSSAEKEKIESLLQKAVELDINYDFNDYTAFPAYILDKYRRIKEAYLAQFSKSARRHNLGIHVMMSYLSASLSSPQNFTLGIHYAFNLSDALGLVADFEVPFTERFYNMMKFRVGAIWFTSFRVETFSLGLGLFNSLSPEANWTAFTDSVSFEGYGEIIFRFGLGMGASIEVVRGDFLFGAATFPAIENVSVFSSDKVRLGFANVRLYLFWTF